MATPSRLLALGGRTLPCESDVMMVGMYMVLHRMCVSLYSSHVYENHSTPCGCLLGVLCCPYLLPFNFCPHRLLSRGDGASEFIGIGKKVGHYGGRGGEEDKY